MVIPRAEVLLGRRSLGTTPLVNVRLPAGRHRLTVRAVDGSASRRVTVTIQANQRTRESLRL
ncbi:MAG: PEGA domain-containing protein [Sandaracinaceae bacterium]